MSELAAANAFGARGSESFLQAVLELVGEFDKGCSLSISLVDASGRISSTFRLGATANESMDIIETALLAGEQLAIRDPLTGGITDIAVPAKTSQGIVAVFRARTTLPAVIRLRDPYEAVAHAFANWLPWVRFAAAHGRQSRALEAAPWPCALINTSSRVLWANDAFSQNASGTAVGGGVELDGRSGDVPALASTASGWIGEAAVPRPDGKPAKFSAVVRRVRDVEPPVFLLTANPSAVAQDRGSGVRPTSLAPTRRASTPEPVGMQSRDAFVQAMRDYTANSGSSPRPGALLVIDLDRFRDVNDTHGIAIGDRLLIAVAHRLRSRLDDADVLGRVGNDEFAILRPVITSSDHAEALAHDLVASLAEAFRVEGREFVLSACVGLATWPHDAKDPHELLQHAELALRRAKASGRRTVKRFHNDLASVSKRKSELVTELRDALVRRELSVHFQPQIDLARQVVIGGEALLRWKHPTRGYVSPAEFIPVAEETGLMVPIGTWALREACLQAKAWERRGLPPLRVAVNISGAQLERQDLPALIERTLRETQLLATRLEIELTESVLMDRSDRIVGMLSKLHNLGVQISIDDFGTGYSSLAYLQKFPVHRLKIDRSFVMDLDAGAVARNEGSIARAIVSLGKSLDLKVLAEGVETEAQRDYLIRCGCDEVQGYFYSKPLAPDDFVSFVLNSVHERATVVA